MPLSLAEKQEQIDFLTASFKDYYANNEGERWLKILSKGLHMIMFNRFAIERDGNSYDMYVLTQFLVIKSSESIYLKVTNQELVHDACLRVKQDLRSRMYAIQNLKELNQKNKYLDNMIAQETIAEDSQIDKAVQNYLSKTGIKMKVSDELKKVKDNYELKVNELMNSVQGEISRQVTLAVESLRPVIIQINSAEPVAIEGKAHQALSLCVKLSSLEKQVFISGPAGTGKTTLARQTAESLMLPFGHISCTLGMSEAHLLGRMTAHGDYMTSQFVTIYEKGGVFLFDEVDAADANTMLIINSALANGSLSIPNRALKPYADRHPEFYCICAANTWGYGSNEYAGRNILDAAFLDRFAGSRMLVDYDTELEKALAANSKGILDVIWKIRANVKENKMRRIVSTRAVVSGVKAIASGDSIRTYVDRFMTGWTEEEIKKASKDIYPRDSAAPGLRSELLYHASDYKDHEYTTR